MLPALEGDPVNATCDCAVHERGSLEPLVCRTLIDTLPRDFLLTDVVFELESYPDGFRSRACGYVWNALPGKWSRLLLGGHVADDGRQYHFSTGLLCPKGSRLSVCTCFFVDRPTSRLWAVLSGCLCDDDDFTVPFPDENLPLGIDWTDAQHPVELDHVDPTGESTHGRGLRYAIPSRELLGTHREMVDSQPLWIDGVVSRTLVSPGATAALRVKGHVVDWECGQTKGSSQCPSGTNLVVVRRSLDGRSLHWICYREDAPDAS
jgi:hypothetical protein